MSDNSDQQTPIGKVYLVGAGPGDRKLITIRGQECLEKADVVVYDRLINPQLLSFCLPESERIYVGKQVAQNCSNAPNAPMFQCVKCSKAPMLYFYTSERTHIAIADVSLDRNI